MANGFSKEEVVMFDRVLEGFQDEMVMSKDVIKFNTDQVMMARTVGNTVWRPMPYILQSYDGLDQSSNFNDKTQLSVPASITTSKSVPWVLDATELRDMLQEDRLATAARQRLGSDIETSIRTAVAAYGSMTIKRTTAAVGYDDLGIAEAFLDESGVPGMNRKFFFSPRDHIGAAANLANRQTMNGKPTTAYERSYIGQLAGFDVLRLQTAARLTAAAATGVTINGANQRYVPAATFSSGGAVSNVDNRFMNLNVTVTSGTIKVGDRFTIAGVNNVHMINKTDTGQLKTFVVTAIVSGAGGTGTIQISPPIIAADSSPTGPEVQYKNCTATPANGAAITWLNTASAFVNPFFHRDCVEILPGRYAVPEAGVQVMTGTTDNGFQITMTKQFDIGGYKTRYRFDTYYGTAVLNPEMCGAVLFNQV